MADGDCVSIANLFCCMYYLFFSILLHSHIYFLFLFFQKIIELLNYAKENRMLINSECFWTFDSIDIWAIVIISHDFSFVFFLAKSMKGRYHCNYLCKYCDWRDFLKFRIGQNKKMMAELFWFFSCQLKDWPALEIRWFCFDGWAQALSLTICEELLY